VRGKLCVVTGANAGIGKVMALRLAEAGASVVLVCRDPRRGETALAEVRRRSGNQRVELMRCDLSSQRSVRDFADAFRASGRRIDVLANNAGIYLPRRQLSPEGHEVMLATNHLGPFLLTSLLLDRLEGGRVVVTASASHALGRIDFQDLHCERRFRPMRQYGTSKLANILFTRELARRGRAHGIVATCFHPGAVASEFGQDAPGLLNLGMRIVRRVLRTPEAGADTGVFLATEPEAAALSGSYLVDRRARVPRGQGRDDALASELWHVSERMTGLAGS